MLKLSVVCIVPFLWFQHPPLLHSRSSLPCSSDCRHSESKKTQNLRIRSCYHASKSCFWGTRVFTLVQLAHCGSIKDLWISSERPERNWKVSELFTSLDGGIWSLKPYVLFRNCKCTSQETASSNKAPAATAKFALLGQPLCLSLFFGGCFCTLNTYWTVLKSFHALGYFNACFHHSVIVLTHSKM